MRFRTKVRFAIDMIVENPTHFIISILLSGAGLCLLGFTMLVYLAGNNGKRTAEEVLTQGIGHTGIVSNENFDFFSESGMNFRKEAYDSEIIHSIGSFNYGSISDGDFSALLYNIQQGHAVNASDMFGDALQILWVDRELLTLCNLQYEDYIPADQLDDSDKDIQYMYLGYAYRDIPVGTIFKYNSMGVTIMYEVAGILKKDTGFASQDLLNAEDFTTLRSDINMNYEIICINDGPSYTGPWMFSVEKNYTLEEGMEELNRIAAANGIEIEVYSLQSTFDNVKQQTQVMQDSLLDMLMLILLVLVIVVTTLQIVQIFHQSHSYGILYSVGFLSLEIQAMMIIRNVIYFVFSFCIGTGLLIGIGHLYFMSDIQSKEVFLHLLFTQVLPVGGILMLILFCIITAIPCYVFNRQDPIKLMQGE